MEIPGPPAVDNPEVIHLAKLVKIELDELRRNIRWLTKRLDKPPLTSRAGSEIPERGKWRVGSKVPLNVYDGDRPVCQCHSFIDAYAIVAAMNGFKAHAPAFDFDERQPPPSGPPTPDLADQPDSTSKDSFTEWLAKHPSPTQRIGVHDYDSLVSCLQSNFEQIHSSAYLLYKNDPQYMIQWMAAEIQNLRREKEKKDA